MTKIRKIFRKGGEGVLMKLDSYLDMSERKLENFPERWGGVLMKLRFLLVLIFNRFCYN